jgi:hypothetical protein
MLHRIMKRDSVSPWSAEGSTTMPNPDDKERSGHKTAHPIVERGPHDEILEDEEKILAGRADVNMPALLTRDVPGG